MNSSSLREFELRTSKFGHDWTHFCRTLCGGLKFENHWDGGELGLVELGAV